MNVLISMDMEGIAGVVMGDHVSSKHKEYERFRKLMTAEANAAVEGALAGGATRVVVIDSHGGMVPRAAGASRRAGAYPSRRGLFADSRSVSTAWASGNRVSRIIAAITYSLCSASW